MSLKQTIFSAGRWTTTSAATRTCLQLMQTLVLARLLLPADFGLMAVAGALTAVVWLLADLGVSRALVHYDDVPDDALSSLYWLNLGMGAALMLLMVAVAPLLGSLYKTPALVPLLQLASLAFPLSACGQQYRVLAEKELHFAALARNEIASALFGFGMAVVVALAGGGVYALVAGMLSNAAASTLLAWWRLSYGRHPRWRFCFREVKPYLRFGSHVVGGNIANTLLRQADVFVGGLVLGPTAIGLYSVPRDLSLKLAMMVNPIITRIGFPLMARTRHDQDALKSIYLQTLRMTASVNFPIYIALALFADEVVALMYGPNFRGAGIYLRILALWGLLRSIGNPVGSLLYAVGRTRLALMWTLGNLILLPLVYWLAVRFGGLPALALSLLIAQICLLIPAWRLLVYPCCGAGLGEFLGEVLVPLLLAIVAGALALLASCWIEMGLLKLAIGGAVGTLAYLMLSAQFNRRWMLAMRRLLKPEAQTQIDGVPR